MTEARAKPLNALTRAALPYGVQIWDDQIAYLNDAITGSCRDNPALVKQFTEHRDQLVRSREWLQSKLDSVEDV